MRRSRSSAVSYSLPGGRDHSAGRSSRLRVGMKRTRGFFVHAVKEPPSPCPGCVSRRKGQLLAPLGSAEWRRGLPLRGVKQTFLDQRYHPPLRLGVAGETAQYRGKCWAIVLYARAATSIG